MLLNNTFNIKRFGILCRQNITHNYKLVLTSLIGFCGGLFILLLSIQIAEGFQPPTLGRFAGLFIIVFIVSAIFCAGTAFPDLRSREKMHNYLMVPASVFEKFLMEFLGRIILFILVIPLVYWVVYNLEGYFVSLLSPAFPFEGQRLEFPLFTFATDTANRRMEIFSLTGGLLIFVIPFTGATIFSKNPLIKTLFATAVIFFFNLALVYFFVEILHFNRYHPTTPILLLRHLEDGLMASIIASVILNVGLIAAAYFKLKEREV